MSDVWKLLVGRALIGLGVAAGLVAGLKAIVLWFPPERVALANGWFIMLGALGALSATGPAEVVVQDVGWRGLFILLAVTTAAVALLIFVIVPEREPVGTGGPSPGIGFLDVCRDPRFWRMAPLAATGVGISNEMFLAGTLVLSMAAQLGLLLRVPVSTHLLFAIVAAAGATTVLSFASLARYFPKEVAGRTNACLGVLAMGAAFGLQCLSGLIIVQWPANDGHYPVVAHQAAMAAGLAVQLIALGVFFAPERRPRQVPMALAVARALGLDPSPDEIMSPRYRAALSAWRRHVVGTHRQAMAWRVTAVASMALCVGLAGALSLVLIRPAVALHVQDRASSRMPSDSARFVKDATIPPAALQDICAKCWPKRSLE